MENKRKVEAFTSVAETVSEAMKEQGVSIRDLAIKLGLTYEHVRRVVRGEAIPSKFILKPLCVELGIDYDEVDKLATGEKIRKKYGAITTDLSPQNPTLEKVQRMFNALNETQQKDLLDMLQVMVQRNRKIHRAS